MKKGFITVATNLGYCSVNLDNIVRIEKQETRMVIYTTTGPDLVIDNEVGYQLLYKIFFKQ